MEIKITASPGITRRETKFFLLTFTYGDSFIVPTFGEYTSGKDAVKEMTRDFTLLSSVKEVTRKDYLTEKNKSKQNA